MKTFRLIRSPAATAARNMALDEEMLNRYMSDGVPVFRVYGWSSPSFTYGVSQSPGTEIDTARCRVDGVQIAGRMTGGGILFHDDEVTYSVVCGKADIGEPDGVLFSYRKICAFLISFYGSLGLKASFALEDRDFKSGRAGHELCSASREKYDIVVNGRKMGGNAQKRKRRSVFQHGSIPISIDWEFMRRYVKSLPEDIRSGVTTLTEELGRVPDRRVLEDMLIRSAEKEFGARFVEEKESFYEARMAE